MVNDNNAWPRGLVVASLFVTLTSAARVGGRAAVPDGYVAAPYYPAPYTGWVSSWSDSVQKAKALVDTMTLAEKANITAGTGFFMGESSPRDKPRVTLGSLTVFRVSMPQVYVGSSGKNSD